MRFLITGATGFVGSRLVPELARRGYKIRIALRENAALPQGVEGAVIGNIADPRNLSEALRGIDQIIHCAGIAHADKPIPEEDYINVNVKGTLHLARAAEKAKVRRFLFLSSVRAQSGAAANLVLNEAMSPSPNDAYGRSKWAAEQELLKLDLDHAALRPVLIYGQGVKGNMAALIKLAGSPWTLPLGALKARRSLLSVTNLIDAIETLLNHRQELRRPFLIADNEALNVGEMITALRAGMGRRSGVIPVPPFLLKPLFAALNREDAYQRLSQPLEVSNQALKQLGWNPRLGAQAGLRELARQISARSGAAW